MKKCSKCGQVKSEIEFYKDKTHKDGLTSVCKVCRKIVSSKWKDANRERVRLKDSQRIKTAQNYIGELKTPCVKCGETRPYLIQFHHIDPSEKKFVLGSTGVFKNKQLIESESKKCICLCSNCHIEYHWLYGKQPLEPIKTLTEYIERNPYEI